MKINKVQIRNLQIEDYDQLAQSFTRVYSDGSDVFWTHKQIEKLIRIFPEGQIVTVVDEKIVVVLHIIVVHYDGKRTAHDFLVNHRHNLSLGEDAYQFFYLFVRPEHIASV